MIINKLYDTKYVQKQSFSFLVTNGRCFCFKEKQGFCNDFRKAHSSSSSSSTSSEPLSPKAPFVVKRRYTFQTLLYLLNSEKLSLLLFSPTYIYVQFFCSTREEAQTSVCLQSIHEVWGSVPCVCVCVTDDFAATYSY